MPSTIISASIAAGATATPLQNTQFEFAGDGGNVNIGVLAEATGVVMTVFMGSDLVTEESPTPIGAANVIPVWPDNYLISETVYPGTRLKVLLRNTSAGTIVTKTAVRIN